jgi:Cft2 family RNA processing exonuclease
MPPMLHTGASPRPHHHRHPIGAGQDVGRSCVVVTMGGRTIMFDCGMHVGYRDERRCDTWRRPHGCMVKAA